MRRIVVNEFLSLDGVAQAPGGATEDQEGDFQHGGWHMKFMEDVAQRWIFESLSEAGGFLLGRRTYEIFAAYWPNAPEEEKGAAAPLNSRTKYVASTTLRAPLEWQNSILLEGRVPEAVAALREQEGNDVHVYGSTRLVQTLMEHGLVDEFRLMIDPVVLGGGKRIFRDDGMLRSLEVIDTQVTATGAILGRYRPMRG